jgi:hypothetical protein
MRPWARRPLLGGAVPRGTVTRGAMGGSLTRGSACGRDQPPLGAIRHPLAGSRPSRPIVAPPIPMRTPVAPGWERRRGLTAAGSRAQVAWRTFAGVPSPDLWRGGRRRNVPPPSTPRALPTPDDGKAAAARPSTDGVRPRPSRPCSVKGHLWGRASRSGSGCCPPPLAAAEASTWWRDDDRRGPGTRCLTRGHEVTSRPIVGSERV